VSDLIFRKIKEQWIDICLSRYKEVSKNDRCVPLQPDDSGHCEDVRNEP